MSVPVLINASGGTARRLGHGCGHSVNEAFAAAGMAVEVRMLPGAAIAQVASALGGRDVIVVGGGDGTLGGAAAALAGKAALGILPLGTRNHLARDLGIPADLAAAAKVIAAGHRRRIDLGRVNGRAFVNNASIGAYPQLVDERDERRGPKWLATIPAAWAVLRRMRHHRLRLDLGKGGRPIATPLLFVGNNRYALEAGRLGERAALDDGLLSVVAVAAQRRRELPGFVWRTLRGRGDARDFAAVGETSELTVAGHGRAIAIALDGEVARLALPLRFTLEARALEVLAPG